MVRECPNCGLVNPPTALRCDCGYEFASGRTAGSPIAGLGRAPTAWARLLVGCVGTVLGVVIGVTVMVPLKLQAASQASDALRAEGRNPCGLIIIGPLFEGVVLGTALGGLVGLIASLWLGWLGARWWARRRTPRGT